MIGRSGLKREYGHKMRLMDDWSRRSVDIAEEEEPSVPARVVERWPAPLTPYLEETLRGRGPDDPLARQYLPSVEELTVAETEVADPIGDEVRSPVPGLVHRYPDRALLIPHHLCAAYCRFCFRRERIGGAEGSLSDADLDRAVDYLSGRPEIREVILTGGDPLMTAPRRLARITTALGGISHIEVVRAHTRLPTSAPDRVTANLIDALKAGRHAVWVAVHINHPSELTTPTRAALARFVDAGVPLLSQTVLLRGINDDPAVLTELFRALARERVKPYYLHQLDHAPGTSHFRVPLERGREIADALVGNLSGLCRPTYVLDIPGGFGKIPAGRSWIEMNGGETSVRDYRGRIHLYEE